jgi:hypothetical protein
LYREKSFYYQKDLKDAGNLEIVIIDSDDEVVDLSSLDGEEGEEGEEKMGKREKLERTQLWLIKGVFFLLFCSFF